MNNLNRMNDKKEDLIYTIEDINNLPTMPTVVSRAFKILRNPSSNIDELAEVVSKDIALTTNILKTVNSAHYGFTNKITTINKAMALLGYQKVKDLILSIALKPMLVTVGSKSLWEHSLRCAVGCEIIADLTRSEAPDEAFVIGLLHDIGKTVFRKHNKAAFEEVENLVKIGADRLKAETTMFGCDHAYAGGLLIKKWKLPSIIIEAIKHHHEPQKSDISSVAGIVYAAECLTQKDLKFPIFDPKIMEELDFELSNPNQIREDILERSQLILKALEKD